MIPKKILIYQKDPRMNLKDICPQRQTNLELMISPNCSRRSYSKDMRCSKNAAELAWLQSWEARLDSTLVSDANGLNLRKNSIHLLIQLTTHNHLRSWTATQIKFKNNHNLNNNNLFKPIHRQLLLLQLLLVVLHWSHKLNLKLLLRFKK